MISFIDNLYNNYKNVTKMTLFNYIKTGNTKIKLVNVAKPNKKLINYK